MVALRKDVKVGLTIGAIAVSVIGVYAGLSALAGEKSTDNNTASLAVSPIDGKRGDVAKSDAKSSAAQPSVTDRSTAQSSAVSSNQSNNKTTAGTLAGITAPAGSAATNTPTAEANPTAPMTARPAGEDPWAVAFGSGSIQPKTTVTPTPGKPADAAADRASTIQSLTADPKTATANAGDPSGSITAGSTSELTRTTPTVSGTSAAASPTTRPGAAASDVANAKSHTVEPGETLYSISNEYYGDSKYFNVIINANPQINPNKLKPGTVVKIPELAKKEPRSDTTEQPVSGATASAGTKIDSTKQYVVKPGDSLQKISSTLWNDSAQSSKLYELNKSVIGSDPTKIKPGMVLTLPSAPTQTAAAR